MRDGSGQWHLSSYLSPCSSRGPAAAGFPCLSAHLCACRSSSGGTCADCGASSICFNNSTFPDIITMSRRPVVSVPIGFVLGKSNLAPSSTNSRAYSNLFRLMAKYNAVKPNGRASTSSGEPRINSLMFSIGSSSEIPSMSLLSIRKGMMTVLDVTLTIDTDAMARRHTPTTAANTQFLRSLFIGDASRGEFAFSLQRKPHKEVLAGLG